MTIYFTNCSSQNVLMVVDNGEMIRLMPSETISLLRKDTDEIKVSIKPNTNSYVSKYIMNGRMYHLVIESELTISGASDGEVFHITREKIRFSLHAFYDRLFLTARNALLLSETFKVLSEERIKKEYNKSRLHDIFIYKPIFDTIGLFLMLLVIGIILTFIWGWKFAIVYCPSAYMFILGVNLLFGRIMNVIGKKAFHVEDAKKEFYSFFENEFIKNYYADTERIPFMGSVEN